MVGRFLLTGRDYTLSIAWQHGVPSFQHNFLSLPAFSGEYPWICRTDLIRKLFLSQIPDLSLACPLKQIFANKTVIVENNSMDPMLGSACQNTWVGGLYFSCSNRKKNLS